MNKILLYFSTLLAIVSSASKWYDGPSRPYEFGYKLENNQHRFEKKDDNGIIMGEFGFITADGVYHITVYATDENGNFKIVSMKNIKLEGLSPSFEMTPLPLKSSQTESPRTTTSRPPPLPPSTTLPKLQFPTKAEPPKFGCSNCVIPETEVTKFQVTTSRPNLSQSTPEKDVGSRLGTQGSPAPSRPSGPSGSSDPNEANVISNEGETGSKPSHQGHQSTSGGAPTHSQGGGQAQQGHQTSGGAPVNQPTQSQGGGQAQQVHQTTSGGAQPNQPTQSQGGGQAQQGHQTTSVGAPPSQPTLSQGGGQAQQGHQTTSGGAPPNQPTLSQEGGQAQGHAEEGHGPLNGPQTSQEKHVPAGSKGSSSPTSSGPATTGNTFNSNGSPSISGLSATGGNSPSQGNKSPPNKLSSTSTSSGGSSSGDSGNKFPSNNSPSSLVPSAEQMKQMLGDLLYKFNYTVGYHGHNEQGDRDGRKEGSYYQVGRDGLRRVVQYKANEFGYQPTITLEKATPEETPDPETERENRRHDYSFKWFFKSFE